MTVEDVVRTHTEGFYRALTTHDLDALSAILAPIFLSKPQYHWMMQLTRAGVPCRTR